MDYRELIREVTEELNSDDEYSGLHDLETIEKGLVNSYSRDYRKMRERGAGVYEVAELQQLIRKELENIF